MIYRRGRKMTEMARKTGMANDGDNLSADIGPSWPEDITMNGDPREFTRVERIAIKKHIVYNCANFDREYGCLLLNGDCYMFYKYWTGGGCKYFYNAVLPSNPMLAASIITWDMERRRCLICGETFPQKGKQLYCSDVCANKAKNRQQRGYMRERRGRC